MKVLSALVLFMTSICGITFADGGMTTGQPVEIVYQILCDADSIDVTHPVRAKRLVLANENQNQKISRAVLFDSNDEIYRYLVLEQSGEDLIFDHMSVYGTKIGELLVDGGQGHLRMTDDLFVERGHEELVLSNCSEILPY